MSASSKTPRLKLPKFNGNDPTSWLGDFNGAMDILDGLFNLFYPVGSYYETSDENFNPNTAWGGTWVEDTQGRVTVAQTASGSFNTISATGGEEKHKLTNSELPKIHGEGQFKPYDGFSVDGTVFKGKSWNVSKAISAASGAHNENPIYGFEFDIGGDTPHNNMPPYKVVKRWHRTA